MSQETPKTEEIGIRTRVTPVQKKCGLLEFSDLLKKWSGDGVDLPWIRSATLVHHVDIAIATTILFLSQMAILS